MPRLQTHTERMLRLVVLILVVANTTYFAWANGLLRAWGVGPAIQTDPQRMAQQVRPDSLRILATAEYSKVEEQVKADLAPKECLQAGDFDTTQAAPLKRALEGGLPSGSCTSSPSSLSASAPSTTRARARRSRGESFAAPFCHLERVDGEMSDAAAAFRRLFPGWDAHFLKSSGEIGMASST